MSETSGIADHVLGWIGTVTVATATLFGGAYVRLFRHEERIKALEDHHATKIEELSSLGRKVDDNHNFISEKLDASVESIRQDLRVIMHRCLNIKHDGAQ